MDDMSAMGIMSVAVLAGWVFGLACLIKREFRLFGGRVLRGAQAKIVGLLMLVGPVLAVATFDTASMGTKALVAAAVVAVLSAVALLLSTVSEELPAPDQAPLDDEDRLRADIDALKLRCQSNPAELTARNLFSLGCMYARLYDRTRSSSHRASALKYMSKAAELDPAEAKIGAFSGGEDSSLFGEPEFHRFVE